MKDLWREPYHVVLEVENRECSILKRLASLGLKRFKVRDIRSSNSKTVKHLIELDPDEARTVQNKVAELRKAQLKNRGGAKPSVWFESTGCKICNTMLSSDAFLVSGKSLADYTIMYSFMVPSFDAYKEIVTAMESEGLKVNVLKMGRFEPRSDVLTERQERIFWVALKGGFLTTQRKLTQLSLRLNLGLARRLCLKLPLNIRGNSYLRPLLNKLSRCNV